MFVPAPHTFPAERPTPLTACYDEFMASTNPPHLLLNNCGLPTGWHLTTRSPRSPVAAPFPARRMCRFLVWLSCSAASCNYPVLFHARLRPVQASRCCVTGECLRLGLLLPTSARVAGRRPFWRSGHARTELLTLRVRIVRPVLRRGLYSL